MRRAEPREAVSRVRRAARRDRAEPREANGPDEVAEGPKETGRRAEGVPGGLCPAHGRLRVWPHATWKERTTCSLRHLIGVTRGRHTRLACGTSSQIVHIWSTWQLQLVRCLAQARSRHRRLTKLSRDPPALQTSRRRQKRGLPRGLPDWTRPESDKAREKAGNGHVDEVCRIGRHRPACRGCHTADKAMAKQAASLQISVHEAS